MSLTIGDNFSFLGSKPLDGRIKYDTLAAMKEVADSTMYEGCLAFCVADGKTYQWKSTNTVDGTTGKWREFTSGGGGGASDLSDLSDVDLSSPTDGQYLKYDASSGKWINANGGSVSVAELGDIGDVDLTSVSDGQIIKWDVTSSKWVNADLPSGVDDLSDLSDVDLSSPTDGQVLTYDASTQKWKNADGGSTTVDELGDIEDVDLTSLQDGQIIVWDATNSKWVNANQGGNISLSNLRDADINSPSDGQVLKYDGTNQAWENADQSLSDNGDVAITSPSNGDVLKYNSTTQKWENGEGGGGAIVNGYAYTPEFNPTGVMDYINWVRAHTDREIKVPNESIFSGKTCNCFYIVFTSLYGYMLFSEYDFHLKFYRLSRSGTTIFNSSRYTDDGTNHVGYNSNGTFQLTNGITTAKQVTIAGSSEVDCDYLADPDKVAQIFVSPSVTIDVNNAYADQTTVIENTLAFYADDTHTTVITPETGKIYVDVPTGDTYEWDGKEYKAIGGGGGGGASDLDDLSDVTITTPTDGQVLTYDATNQVWKNAAGGGGTIAHLGDITDVDLNNIADGQMIAWDATNSKWVNVNAPSSGASDLDDLSDVTLSSPTNGQILKYNTTSQKWENANESGGGASDLGDLDDVNLTTPTDGQILKYDATNDEWVNDDESGTEYTAGDGIEIDANNEISIKEMAAADMNEVITQYPSTRSGGTVLKQTLTAGSTTVTFTGLPTTGDYIIDFFNSLGVNYTGITPSSGQVVLTFSEQSSNMDVYCEIREV